MGNCFSTIMSHVLSFSERFSILLSFIAILTCAVLCMICMLGFGIGLGYNYSYVDYRTKHNYVKGQYKKVRPTSYYGPGFYKPSTIFKNRPTRKKSFREMRKHLQGEHVLDPDVTFEPPHDLPFESPDKMVQNWKPQGQEPQVDFKTRETEKEFERIYFNKLTTKPRLLTVRLDPEYDKTVASTDAMVQMYDGKEEKGNALNDSEVNETSYMSEQEASVTVNVTKTLNDTSPPFIIKTMMHPNHLSKWLSRLRQANKTFAVHVITN